MHVENDNKPFACRDGGVPAGAFRSEQEFHLRLCDQIGTDFARGARDLLQTGDVKGYLALHVDPSRYNDHQHFAGDYLVAEVLRKSANLPWEVDLEDEARAKFKSAEQRNRETNDRMYGALPEWWGDYSRELLTLLGPCDRATIEECVDLAKHGKGATVGVKGEGIVPSDKYDCIPTVTENLQPFLMSLMPAYMSADFGRTIKVVKGSRHFTVSKNATARRSCAKEPTWNVFIQLGIGRKIRRRLLRYGVDLRDQTRNQFLASKAMVWGSATIDLSQASDLNARLAVWNALCYNQDPQGMRWWQLLSLARSEYMNVAPPGSKAEWVRLEMMSSMGNGYTFALETAVFLALARTVVPKEEHWRISVYGDDIIVPTAYAPALIDRLEFVGFKTNRRKTFLAGEFFESCGTDWFCGHNVRPFYVNSEDDANVPWTVSAANALRLWLVRVYGYCPLSWKPLWDWLVEQVPHPWNCPVSPSLGDTGILVSQDERVFRGPMRDDSYSLDRKNPLPGLTWEGVVVKHVVMAPEVLDKRTYGVLAACLSATRGRHFREEESRRYPGESIEGFLRRVGLDDWCTLLGTLPTYGREPMRGYLRQPRTTKTIVEPWGLTYSWM